MLNKDLLDLRERLNAENTAAGINAGTQKFLERQGFDSFVYGYAITPDDIPKNTTGIAFETTIGEDLLEIYTDNGGLKRDPIADRVFDIHRPEIFDNKEIYTDPKSRFCNDFFIEAALDLQIDLGALCPIKGAKGAGSFMAWTRGGTRQERSDLANSALHNLMPAIGGLYHAAIHRDQRLASSFSLTGAELDALNYIAYGYTASSLADKLRISERAVEKRLSRARHKLGAGNTTNAVYRAAIFNLI